jgi:hypothetical protein
LILLVANVPGRGPDPTDDDLFRYGPAARGVALARAVVRPIVAAARESGLADAEIRERLHRHTAVVVRAAARTGCFEESDLEVIHSTNCTVVDEALAEPPA